MRLCGVPDLSGIKDNNGILYSNFRRKLTPKYIVIFLNFVLPIFMIVIPILLVPYVLNKAVFLSFFLTIVCGVWIGFWLHAYMLHFHEAAHFNLAPNRKLNDFLANLFLTPFTGILVADYRVSHWQHHLHLGTLRDTEISYHNPLTLRSLIEGCTGIYLLKSAFRYIRTFRNIDLVSAKKGNKSSHLILTIFVMLVTQIFILYILIKYASIYMALSWLIGFFIVAPFIGQIRQCLEHRSLDASKNINYSVVEHGPVNRIFGEDFFSSYFGAAGFNRHLIHHCDPSISYTRFKELEMFLLNSEMKNFTILNKNTYHNIFLSILNK